MKTFKNLYPQIHTWENLENAYRKARKGKRGKVPAADFAPERLAGVDTKHRAHIQ